MDCEDRLKAAAHFILSNDRRIEEDPPLDCSALGVSAVLKPHQIDGVSWLIRRYRLGVNVILGIFRNYSLRAISYIRIEYLYFVFCICVRRFIRVWLWLQETRSGSSPTQLSWVRCIFFFGIDLTLHKWFLWNVGVWGCRFLCFLFICVFWGSESGESLSIWGEWFDVVHIQLDSVIGVVKIWERVFAIRCVFG